VLETRPVHRREQTGAEGPVPGGTFGRNGGPLLDAPYDEDVLAINGFLEWFFLVLLTFLVAAVTVFGLFVAIQFFRNPGRRSRR
jgi:hypothetical protein